jgi:hypothetical protein
MAKKIVIGMLATFVCILIASAGYSFGQRLAQAEKAAETQKASGQA